MSRRAGLGHVAAAALLLLAIYLPACGGHTTPVPSSTSEDGGTTSGAASASASADGVAFMQGNVACCETGLGTSCCTAAQKDQGACQEFLGCRAAGQGISGKIQCMRCCDGLVPMSPSRMVDGKCESPQFLDSNVCAPCGDGVCSPESGENACSCPADCH